MGDKIFIYYNNDESKTLVELYGTTDKAELTKLIKSKSLMKAENLKQTTKEKIEYQKALKLQLENYKLVNELFPQKAWEEKLAIINGSQPLPELDSIEKIAQAPARCTRCNHEHTTIPPRVCKRADCSCLELVQ